MVRVWWRWWCWACYAYSFTLTLHYVHLFAGFCWELKMMGDGGMSGVILWRRRWFAFFFLLYFSFLASCVAINVYNNRHRTICVEQSLTNLNCERGHVNLFVMREIHLLAYNGNDDDDIHAARICAVQHAETWNMAMALFYCVNTSILYNAKRLFSHTFSVCYM